VTVIKNSLSNISLELNTKERIFSYHIHNLITEYTVPISVT